MANLTDLPIELVHLVFQHMTVVEICTCRLVSRWFNETVKAFRVFELSFYESDWLRKTSWFADDKPILPLNSLRSSKVSFLSSRSIDLRFLRRLSKYNVKEGDRFRLELLNSFLWLEHLELQFEQLDWCKGDCAKSLRLNQLKYLYLEFKFQIFIEFNTPKLSTLALSYEHGDYEPVDVHQLLESIHFVHPATVRSLYLFDNLNTSGEFPIPSSFEGVEHLQCDLTAWTHRQMKSILEKFSHLKVLEVWRSEGDEFYEVDFDLLDQIMQQKEKLKPSLRLYFCDVELSSRRTARSYAFDRQSKLASLLQNYSSLVYSHTLWVVVYDELLRLTKGDYQILKLFNTTIIVHVREHLDDPDRFLHFLLNCPNLKSLTFENAHMDSEFYRMLPAYSSLIELNIREDQDLELDFEFLLKIENLINFTTNQNLALHIIRRMAQLKFVNYFEFKIRNVRFAIEKIDGQFELKRKTSWYSEYIEYCHDVPKLGDLLEYFEKFESDDSKV